MHSQELADLAGVSVRTLRHYHKIGLLPEPARAKNGYRTYTLIDAAMLLRIRRLAALGISLDQMAPYLEDDNGEQATALLDRLDQELTDQIDRLLQQRQQIAHLRATGRRADLPAGFDAFITLTGSLGTNEIANLERDASLVMARIADDTHQPDLDRLGEAVTAADKTGALTDLVARFQALDPSSSDNEIHALADHFLHLLGSSLSEFLATETGRRLRQTSPNSIPTPDDDPRLNPAQAAALRIVADALDSD